METLQALVRNLAIILLIATFLEMLLPNNSMRSFVHMVMGLFVISAVLNPITALLRTPLSMEIPAWTTTIQQDLPAIAVESQGEKIGQDAIQEQYRQILIRQIKALALGVPGVADAGVEIEFEGGGEGMIDQPPIAEVKVLLTAHQETVKPVQPIVIGEDTISDLSQTPKAERVKERIATFLNLSSEKISVQES